MTQTETAALVEFAKEITEETSRYIREMLRGETIEVKFKTSPSDLVTEVDREVERRLIARIKERFPDHGFLGEEGVAEENGEAEYTWVIDPIDGTTNFVHQRINFCVSVALFRVNEGLAGVIFDPAREEMFWAGKGLGAFHNGDPIQVSSGRQLEESLLGTNLLWVGRTRKWGLEEQIKEIARTSRGIRSLGAAALELAYVAAGRLDGFISLHLSPWDFAAGKVIVEEAGGKVTDIYGNSIGIKGKKTSLIAAPPELHSRLLELLKPAGRK